MDLFYWIKEREFDLDLIYLLNSIWMWFYLINERELDGFIIYWAQYGCDFIELMSANWIWFIYRARYGFDLMSANGFGFDFFIELNMDLSMI